MHSRLWNKMRRLLRDEGPLGCLTVAAEGEGVAALPRGTGRATNGLGELVSLTQTAALLAGGGEATELTVLHGGLADPVHARIATDSLMARINKDHLVVLVGGILIDPVGVQDTEVRAATANTLLSNRLQVTGGLQLVHTMASGLTADLTLGNLALAASTADTDAINDVSLLGLVAETASLVGAGGTAGTVDDVELTELPAADAEDETEDIRLLLLIQLLNVLVGTHTTQDGLGWMREGGWMVPLCGPEKLDCTPCKTLVIAI